MIASQLIGFTEYKDPMTREWARPTVIPNHFGSGVAGIKFECGTIYNPDRVEIKMR